MNKTSIQWTDETWNPLVGCRRVSEGCRNCYAERLVATRLSKHPVYRGLAIMKDSGPQFTGDHRIIADRLDEPLRKRKGVKVFVNDLGDLFYEGHTNEEIAAVFGVMAAAPRHTFQVLTKRARRMAEWFAWIQNEAATAAAHNGVAPIAEILLSISGYANVLIPGGGTPQGSLLRPGTVWPLPNVWLGTSTEDQATADARIPELIKCPATVRFLSVEPQIGPINLEAICHPEDPSVHWVIQGGESGPRARPFDLAWARSLRDQCKAAGTAYFLKQLGANAWTDRVLRSDGSLLEVTAY
ncbi:MAG: DUF5131 family protein, partial [Acidobacteriota bacterium]